MSDSSPRFTPETLRRLLRETLARATHRESMLHGEAHWRAVAWTFLELLPHVPGADPAVGLLFGMLHDSQRLDDGHDPQHGPRAARFTEQLAAEDLVPMNASQLKLLIHAIDTHTGGRPTENPTIGLCYDADRLNLWRIGVRPDPIHLSTRIAKEPDIIAIHERLPGERARWDELFTAYLERTDQP